MWAQPAWSLPPQESKKFQELLLDPLSSLYGYWKLRQQMSKKGKPLSKWEESFHHRLLNKGGCSQLSIYHHMGFLRKRRPSLDVCPPLRPTGCLEITFFPAFLRSGDEFPAPIVTSQQGHLWPERTEGNFLICAMSYIIQLIYTDVSWN